MKYLGTFSWKAEWYEEEVVMAIKHEFSITVQQIGMDSDQKIVYLLLNLGKTKISFNIVTFL